MSMRQSILRVLEKWFFWTFSGRKRDGKGAGKGATHFYPDVDLTQCFVYKQIRSNSFCGCHHSQYSFLSIVLLVQDNFEYMQGYQTMSQSLNMPIQAMFVATAICGISQVEGATEMTAQVWSG